MSRLEEVATVTVDEAFKLHRDWGPGLIESFYRSMLARGLERRGLHVAQEIPISFHYGEELYSNIFRADLLVEDMLLVELKSVEALLPLHSKQLLTYLRVTKLPLGLLVNFGSAMFRGGVRRILNPAAGLLHVVDLKSGLPAGGP
jgi:iron complex transport system substrate-binding protein